MKENGGIYFTKSEGDILERSLFCRSLHEKIKSPNLNPSLLHFTLSIQFQHLRVSTLCMSNTDVIQFVCKEKGVWLPTESSR